MASPVVIQGRTGRADAEAEGVFPSVWRAIEAAGWVVVADPSVNVDPVAGEFVYWTVVLWV